MFSQLFKLSTHPYLFMFLFLEIGDFGPHPEMLRNDLWCSENHTWWWKDSWIKVAEFESVVLCKINVSLFHSYPCLCYHLFPSLCCWVTGLAHLAVVPPEVSTFSGSAHTQMANLHWRLNTCLSPGNQKLSAFGMDGEVGKQEGRHV